MSGSMLSTQLTLQDDCIRMPTVELNGVMTGESGAEAVLQDDQGTLGNLELDSGTNGSIFVFTDPTNLATLQVRLVYLFSSVTSDPSDVLVRRYCSNLDGGVAAVIGILW